MAPKLRKEQGRVEPHNGSFRAHVQIRVGEANRHVYGPSRSDRQHA